MSSVIKSVIGRSTERNKRQGAAERLDCGVGLSFEPLRRLSTCERNRKRQVKRSHESRMSVSAVKGQRDGVAGHPGTAGRDPERV